MSLEKRILEEFIKSYEASLLQAELPLKGQHEFLLIDHGITEILKYTVISFFLWSPIFNR